MKGKGKEGGDEGVATEEEQGGGRGRDGRGGRGEPGEMRGGASSCSEVVL